MQNIARHHQTSILENLASQVLMIPSDAFYMDMSYRVEACD